MYVFATLLLIDSKLNVFPHELLQFILQLLPKMENCNDQKYLLSLLVGPEGLEPLELMRVDECPLLRLLVGLLDLRELLHKLQRLLLLLLELLLDVLRTPPFQSSQP